MPTVFREGGYRFCFYSNEGFEPRHIHVIGHGGEAKFWIPSRRLVWSHNLNAVQLKQIFDIIKADTKRIKRAWDAHFNRGTN